MASYPRNTFVQSQKTSTTTFRWPTRCKILLRKRRKLPRERLGGKKKPLLVKVTILLLAEEAKGILPLFDQRYYRSERINRGFPAKNPHGSVDGGARHGCLLPYLSLWRASEWLIEVDLHVVKGFSSAYGSCLLVFLQFS
ncbi:hypothetical protein Ancab_011935 [Ancistrocladus abbreviatus]